MLGTEARTELEHINIAGIDASAAVRAIAREDQPRSGAFERGRDDVRLRAGSETCTAIGTGLTVDGAYSGQALGSHETVERADGAKMAAPTSLGDKEVQQENGGDDAPACAHAENDAALKNADGI